MYRQSRILAEQLDLARVPVISLSQRVDDYKPGHSAFEFLLKLENQSPRHARVKLKVKICVGDKSYSHPSDHFNGNFDWAVEAHRDQDATILQEEIFEELNRNNINEQTLRKRWNKAPDLSYKNRERESVFILEFDIIYAPFDPNRKILSDNVLRLPPLRWYYNFDKHKWSKEVTPTPWKEDGIDLQELAEQGPTIDFSKIIP